MRLSENLFDSRRSSEVIESTFILNSLEPRPTPNRCFSPSLEEEYNNYRRTSLLSDLFPNTPDAEKRYGNLIPKYIPFGVDIIKNHTDSADMNWNFARFFNSVRNKAKWDYKQQGSQYQDFGNWAFGVESEGFSHGMLPDNFFKRGAGWAQTQAGTSKPEWGHWWGGGSFGDDPHDQTQIDNGLRAIRESLRLKAPRFDNMPEHAIPFSEPGINRLRDY